MRTFVKWAAAAAMLVVAPLAVPTTASADSVSVTVGDGPVRHHWRDGYRYRVVDRDWRRDRRDWRRHHRPDVCRVVVKKRVVWRNGNRVVITDRIRRCRDW